MPDAHTSGVCAVALLLSVDGVHFKFRFSMSFACATVYLAVPHCAHYMMCVVCSLCVWVFSVVAYEVPSLALCGCFSPDVG